MQLNPISNSNAHSYDVRNVLCALTRTSYVQHFHQMEKRVIIVNRIFFLPRVRSEIEKKHTHNANYTICANTHEYDGICA